MNGNWRLFARCRGMDTEIFYPSEHRPEQNEIAIAICRECPVIGTCLSDALDDAEFGIYGIRGGTSARHRKRIRLAERTQLSTVSV